MYKVTSNSKKGFDVTSKSGHGKYLLKIKEGDTPMDLFTVAFSGCILMCVKGYFFRKYDLTDVEMDIQLEVDYENEKCQANIKIKYDLKEEDVAGILENIRLRCKISHLLKKEVMIDYVINKK